MFECALDILDWTAEHVLKRLVHLNENWMDYRLSIQLAAAANSVHSKEHVVAFERLFGRMLTLNWYSSGLIVPATVDSSTVTKMVEFLTKEGKKFKLWEMASQDEDTKQDLATNPTYQHVPNNIAEARIRFYVSLCCPTFIRTSSRQSIPRRCWRSSRITY